MENQFNATQQDESAETQFDLSDTTEFNTDTTNAAEEKTPKKRKRSVEHKWTENETGTLISAVEERISASLE